MSSLRREKGVILDEGFVNSSTVEVMWQTEKLIYTGVKDEEGNEWSVMTYRLTKIKS